MKKKTKDDVRSEYDFTTLEMVARGKYARRYRAGSNIVMISPDIAKVFPTTEAVNEALRLLVKITELSKRTKRRKAM